MNKVQAGCVVADHMQGGRSHSRFQGKAIHEGMYDKMKKLAPVWDNLSIEASVHQGFFRLHPKNHPLNIVARCHVNGISIHDAALIATALAIEKLRS